MHLMMRAKNRLQPLGKTTPAEDFRQPDPAGGDRTNRQQHQWKSHCLRRFMEMGLHMMVGTALAEKDQKELTEHIKGRKPWPRYSPHPKQGRAVRAGKGLPQAFV